MNHTILMNDININIPLPKNRYPTAKPNVCAEMVICIFCCLRVIYKYDMV